MKKITKKIVEKKEESTLIGRIDLPTIFCDKIFLVEREETDTNTKNYIISCAQRTLEDKVQYIEQSRIMLKEPHLKKVMDMLCKTLDYFPEKKEER